MLRGDSEGGSSTAQHSEQPVVCVADGEGEWCRGSGPQERCGHTTCPSQPSNAARRLYHVWRRGGGWSMLRGGGEGAIRTAHDSEQPVGCVADGEGER